MRRPALRSRCVSATTLIAAVLAFSTPATAQKRETGFLERSLTRRGETYKYQIYVPPDYDPKRPSPAILFLHGSGERGTDGARQATVGLGPAIREHPERWPFVVVMPQCRPGTTWIGDMADLAMETLDRTSHEYKIDRNRVYLSGLSMGGFGTWILASSHRTRFAAIAPICAFADPTKLRSDLRAQLGLANFSPSDLGIKDGADVNGELARRVGRTPTWAFHGAADSVVPVSESRRMVELLRNAAGNVKYSEYDGVDHNSWDRAFADPELPLWLLSQKR